MNKHNTFVVVKTVLGNLIDVFWGTGWYNWSRVQVNDKEFSHIAGIKLPFYVRLALNRYLKI